MASYLLVIYVMAAYAAYVHVRRMLLVAFHSFGGSSRVRLGGNDRKPVVESRLPTWTSPWMVGLSYRIGQALGVVVFNCG